MLLVPIHHQPSPAASFDDLAAAITFKAPPAYPPHCGLQIIQLDEAPPMPPRQVSYGSSFASSSYYSSEYSESACSDDEEEDGYDDEEDEEEVCSSYCSSAPEELEGPAASQEARAGESKETWCLRWKRILAWREDFFAQVGSCATESAPATQSTSSSSLAPPSSLKRKLDLVSSDGESDHASRSSKRSRSESTRSDHSSDLQALSEPMLGITLTSTPPTSPYSTATSSLASCSTSSLLSASAYACAACDASFETKEGLREHGREAGATACCVAVEYAFE